MAWFKKLFEASLVGALLGVGFVIPAMWWCSFIGVAYFMYLLEEDRMTISLAWFAWGVKYLLTLWWFWSVYPIDWFGISLGWFEIVGIGFYWTTAAVWLGSGGALLVYLYRLVKKRLLKFATLLLPGLWLVSELFGALFFSIVTYGPGASIGTQFSFGFVGYHLAQHGLFVQTSAVAGVYVLTIILVALSSSGLHLYHQQKNWVLLGSLVLIFLTSFSTFKDVSSEKGMTSIATVDTSISPSYWQTDEGLAKKRSQIEAAYSAAQSTDADYILLPEDARLFDQSLGTSSLKAYLSFTHDPTSPIVIDSGRVEVGGQSLLRGLLYDPAVQKVTTSHKQYLVPQGEFVPTLYYWLLKSTGLGEVADTMKKSFSYVIGEKQSQEHFEENLPALLFCLESVDPKGVKKILSGRTDVPFVAHAISHGWFNDPVTLWPQLESMLKVQAIWNDVYIVSASNHAAGYTVTPQGNILVPEIVDRGEQWQVGRVIIPIDHQQ